MFQGDEDLDEAVGKWAAKGKLEKLAEWWAQGLEVDWERLYVGRRPRRVPLPTYPFARERYWLPEARRAADAPAIAGALHPLLHRNTSRFGRQQFTSRFDGREFFLRDHRLHGESVLPGVAYLEMARVAGELASGATIREITNLGWFKPITLGGEPRDVVVTLTQTEGQIAFQVFSGDVASGAHAEGFLTTGPWPEPARIDLAAVRARCQRRTLDKEECYRLFERQGAQYGPAFQALETIAVGERELIARLALPACVAGDAAELLLHPSLLDGALQASIGLGLGEGAAAAPIGLPFALKALTVGRRLSPSMLAHVRSSHGSGPTQPLPEIDVDLCDEQGHVCVAFRGLAFRRSGASPPKPVAQLAQVALETVDRAPALILQPAWRSFEPPARPEAVSPSERIVVLVERDEATRREVDRGLARPSIALSATSSGIETRYSAHAEAVFTALQALLRERPAERTLVQLVVPLDGVEQVFVGLRALLDTTHQENPLVTGQILAMSTSEPAQVVVDRLEACSSSGALCVRYRSGNREQRTWEPAAVADDARPVWDADDCVLITGGAGGLGRLVAAHVAASARGIRLFLAGRSAPGPDTRRAVQELLDLGATASYLQADVGRRADVDALVGAIASAGRPLSGVIHAAGVIHDNFIIKKTPAEFRSVLAPKVAGLVHLDDATRRERLKHFVAFASVAGALGNSGQADYAAANAFMDAYCHYRNGLVDAGARHGKSTAIDWTLWQQGGMTAPEALQRTLEQRLGLRTLSTPAGLAAFDRCLGATSDQLLVLSGARHEIARSLGLELEPEVPAAPGPRVVAASSSRGAALSSRGPLLAFIRDICARVLKIPAEQLHSQKSFASYGIDSLMVADITVELEAVLGALPKTLFFQYQNLDELTDSLLAQHREQLRALPVEPSEPARAALVAPAPRAAPAPLAAAAEPAGGRGELLRKSELTAAHTALLASIAGEGFLGSYLFDLWSWLYVARDGQSFIHAFLDEDRTLFVTCYRGPAHGEGALLRELIEFGRARGCQVCYWSFAAPDPALEEAHGWISAPIGVVQVLPDIAGFDLSGGRGRKLRYVVKRFAQAGRCETRECLTVTDDLKRQIAEVVSRWCEHKRFVHSVQPFIAELAAGTWRRRYRMFLTHLDGALQNVLLVTGNPRDGYLMDQEYYRPDMPMGGVEFAVVEIIERLKAEGCRRFSLGMTWGVIVHEQGSDEAGKALLADTQRRETFLSQVFRLGEKNYQFKNKFQPVDEISCLYRPRDSQPQVIIRFLSMFMEQGVRFADIQASLRGLTTPAATHFDATRIPPDEVRVDMITDSWVYGRSRQALDRRRELAARIDPGRDYEATIREVLGCPPLHLTPLGRSAERLLFQALSARGRRSGTVIANLLFETAIHHLASEGFQLVEVPDARVDELRDAEVFRGGLDLGGLGAALERPQGAAHMVFLELCNNASGGHPVSMGQLRETASLTARHGALLVLDITRIVKNALLIRDLEPGFGERTTWSIVREIVGHADVVVGSLSKEFGLDMGGIVASRDAELLAGVRELARLEGGYISDVERATVGEAFRDLAWIEEACRAQAARTGRVRDAMERAGISCVSPAPAHCVVVPVLRLPGYAGRKRASAAFLQRFWEQTGIRGGVHLPGNRKESALNECARFCVPLGFGAEQEEFVLRALDSGALEGGTPRRPPRRTTAPGDAVAIVGMSGRFPGARTIEEFWSNIKAGATAIGEIPEERWDWREVFDDPDDARRGAVRWGAFMPDVEAFDARFFDLSPREARLMDPQQRLMLQCAWEAIEDAGYTRAALRQGKTGVFIACPSGDSPYTDGMPASDRVVGLGTIGSIVASRVSYHLNLLGPSEAYDTGCSSSFLALHRAIQALRLGDCRQALVGGVQVLGGVQGYKDIAAIGFLSRAGCVRSFDERADGYVRAESVGALLIKRLDDALAAGDHVWALVRGTGLCHGGGGLGLTTPSVNGMKEAMLQAYRQAGIDPRSVPYIEAHGIASAMGDALELEALRAAYDQLVVESRQDLPAGACHVGSLKPNIGHPEVASGLCALIKVVMALREGLLPGILGFAQPNRRLSARGGPFVLSAESRPWSPLVDREGRLLPRRASLNSYGVGGVNAHVLLEAHDDGTTAGVGDEARVTRTPCVWVFSARRRESLERYVRKFSDYLERTQPGPAELEPIAQTLQVGREAHEERLATVAASAAELSEKLALYLADVSGGESLALRGVFTGRSALPVEGLDRPARLAAEWAAGADVQWDDVYPDRPPRRVSLPTYVFADDSARPGVTRARDHVAPRTDVERRMAEIWSEVLGVSPVGVHDDFFALGGQSVLALQLANRLSLASFDVSVRDLYDHSTIDALSRRVSASPADPAPVSLPAQPFPLLPIQAMLVGRKPASDPGSRDAVPSFIAVRQDVDEGVLLRALRSWYAQDVFRLRFASVRGEWSQSYSAEVGELPIRQLELGPLPDGPAHVRALLRAAHELERDLDVASGPLVQVGLLRSGGRCSHLLWVVDHLVTDTFSFFTLLTNLTRCYEQARRGGTCRFARDVIVTEWARRQFEAAQQEHVVRELDFWAGHFAAGPTAGRGGVGRIESCTELIDAADTSRCYAWLAAHKMTLDELCLASMLTALRSVARADEALVRVVANGRDAEGLDLTRGLGWFSVLYPARFRLEQQVGEDLLEAVVRQHRAYADKRRHYGLLRWMNRECAAQLAAVEDWSQALAFNCLGELDAHRTAGGPFSEDQEGLRALLEFTAERQDYDRGMRFFVLDGKLHFQALFRESLSGGGEMQRLLRETREACLEICRSSPHFVVAAALHA